MKTFFTMLTLLALAVSGHAADRKDRKGKDDKEKDKKEAVMQKFNVIITGAKESSTQADLKSALGSIEGAKVASFESSEKECVAVLETSGRLSRGDVGKAIKSHSALKENKDLKVTEFKQLRPEREGKEKDKEKEKEKTDKKDEKPEEKKDDKKTEEKTDAK